MRLIDQRTDLSFPCRGSSCSVWGAPVLFHLLAILEATSTRVRELKLLLPPHHFLTLSSSQLGSLARCSLLSLMSALTSPCCNGHCIDSGSFSNRPSNLRPRFVIGRASLLARYLFTTLSRDLVMVIVSTRLPLQLQSSHPRCGSA